VFVYAKSAVANGAGCLVHPNDFVVMVIVVILSHHTLFVTMAVLIMYTKYEFQLEIIMLGVWLHV
jgi:hypothetical protein